MEAATTKMYPGSRYANRMPIGSIDVIRELQAGRVEGLLQKMVSSGLASDYHRGRRKCRSSGGNDQKDVRRCPCPGQPGKTGTSIGSDNDLPLISIAKDKEASNTILYIFYKHDKLPNDLNRTIAGLVKDYIQQYARRSWTSVSMISYIKRILRLSMPNLRR